MEADAALIREILARECETVTSYEVLAARATDATTRSLILHLAHEEKEHIAECARYLARLDADYATFLKAPLRHTLEDGSTVEIPELPAQASEPTQSKPQAQWPPTSFTIGSLIERRRQETAR